MGKDEFLFYTKSLPFSFFFFTLSSSSFTSSALLLPLPPSTLPQLFPFSYCLHTCYNYVAGLEPLIPLDPLPLVYWYIGFPSIFDEGGYLSLSQQNRPPTDVAVEILTKFYYFTISEY